MQFNLFPDKICLKYIVNALKQIISTVFCNKPGASEWIFVVDRVA